MITSLLIANRGEIACRIMRTARNLGIHTIAVYSDADAEAPHVKLADTSIHIGPSPAAESYLRSDKILAAAKEAGAEAIHPGYGFLSENVEFAQSVFDAGLVWVGPNPDSIRAMGLKDAAKDLMIRAGVPTTPGYLGGDQSPKRLKAEADTIGYPVLIKAIAGGGGKGMRKVTDAKDFDAALTACKREAKASFGDDNVLLEKWVTNPRHIEVQIFGDTHGNMVHLFERDCTLQRRHQKVIEEAPAPGMSAETRELICATAVRAAQAVNYVGAGTIEFIADGSEGLDAKKIWFMEMNTRLQVEHPVTEAITGVDLVEWQLRIASGEQLPRTQDQLSINGWAMEARLYAENPSTGFLPSTGRLDALRMPQNKSVRIDTGVEQGGEVSPFYDPMIAKLIAFGPNRQKARSDLALACANVATWPVHNNAGFLCRLLHEQAFVNGLVTTGFIDENLDALTLHQAPSECALGAAASKSAERFRSAPGTVGPDAVWSSLNGFRSGGPADLEAYVMVDGEPLSANFEHRTSYSGLAIELDDGVLVVEAGWPTLVTLPVYGVDADGHAASDGSIRSPMPGRVVSLDVREGDTVSKGQKLATLEAMKMEHDLTAPFDGVVTDLSAVVNTQVTEGALLMRIEAQEAST